MLGNSKVNYMRMWLVPPEILCNQHLLGEHNEIHMFFGSLKARKKLSGYFKNNLLEALSLFSRHEELVMEMRKRNFKHLSDLTPASSIPDLFDYLSESEKQFKIDRKKSLNDLISRCEKCRENYFKYIKNIGESKDEK